jgi:hypothetical protein
MTADLAIWYCTLHVERQHGNGAPDFITQRIQDLDLAQDDTGVAAWKAVGARLVQLNLPTTIH